MIVNGYIYTYLYLFLIIIISTILNKYFNINQSITRKFVHISIAFCYIILYKFLKNTIHLIIPPLSFIFINILSYKFNIFKGMENNKGSYGTIYYPVSVFIMALISYFDNSFYPYFGIGLFCMAFGDGLAPIVSNSIKSKKIFKDKTISGTITVFVASLIVILVFNNIFSLDLHLIKIVFIACISTVLELISINGIDNLSLPLGVSVLSFLIGGL